MTCDMSASMPLLDLLKKATDDAVAMDAPGQESLCYGELLNLVEITVLALNRNGIHRNDRVALVLPNGPEMAASFIAISCGATAAPLNPAYQKPEFDFYLSDLNAVALIVEENSNSPALESAQDLNIPVMLLKKGSSVTAGGFGLEPVDKTQQDDTIIAPEFAQRDDIALVLHTSGTTSRPKIVPLTQGNICASADNIRKTLALRANDRCLNVMPLFHIHGLIAAILASISAGASIFCTPGFNALRFLAWLEEARPSWYTAVPTMHQAILARAGKSKETVRKSNLRFIRSSSASLPPQVLHKLEETFNAPVIEAYAMTEAAHQMTSNPLPPGTRKPGTVGIPAGPKVAIMDETGNLLEQGSTGEVVIQGNNVTAGYDNNPAANRENFVNGWFRTGDQGVMDEDGYLTITGRLKEIINRGGEKISPREVDEVLLDHPAVTQAVTFAVPHDKLGEEVAAAVVLSDGQTVSESDIRAYTADYLAGFKVPKKVLILDDIPKGATGKVQRIGLAGKLGLT